MKHYTLKKAFNNNAVMVTFEGQEYILMGRGIGYNKQKGELIPESKLIENVYVDLDESNKTQYMNLLEEVDEKIFTVVEEVIAMAEKDLGEKLHVDTHFGLVDHINFAMRRIREGITVVNPFLLETKMLYQEEFRIAEKAVRMIKARLNMDIPEAETGFITFHIHGGRARCNKESSLNYVKALSQVMEYIQDKLGILLDESSFDSVRLVSHLRGLIERCTRRETIENVLLDKMKEDFAYEFKISQNIGLILERKIGIVVPESEAGYLALHLYKLNHKKSNV